MIVARRRSRAAADRHPHDDNTLLQGVKMMLENFGEPLGRSEDCIKMAISAPGAIFEVLPRAKKLKLGQMKKKTL